MIHRLTALAVVAVVAAATAAFGDANGRSQYGSWGFDLSGMDKALRPGDDFYMHANGGWDKSTVMPDDRSYIGSFQELTALSEERIDAILRELMRRPNSSLNDEERKLRDFYAAYVDESQIEAKGTTPAANDLAYLEGMAGRNDAAVAMGDPRLRINGIFNMSIAADSKHPDTYAITLSQGGLGLPNRDYYLSEDKSLASTRDAYKTYIAGMFSLLGLKNAVARAGAVFALEAKIAQAHWRNEDKRNADKTYNPMTISELRSYIPQFPWKAYFAAGHIPLHKGAAERVVIVAEKSAFPQLAAVYSQTPLSVWRDYLTIRYLDAFAQYLPKRFDEAQFAFYGAVVSGNTKQLPRATRAGGILTRRMGEALGKQYVAHYFPPEAKSKAAELVSNLLKAYDEDIRTLDWMTPQTRAKALSKLHHFGVKIAYPDHWRDYSMLRIARDNLIGDAQNLALFDWSRNVDRLDQPVDRSEWGLPPQIVDAYYSSQQNEIVFPAAILQPPFFDPNADDAVNYGGIGAVIGHEISHGFDDEGSKYDGTGTLSDWWTPEDRKSFESRVAMLGQQYDVFEPLPGLHVNGAFTMGENIADNAGIAIALKAYHASLGGKQTPSLDGYSGDQRFYLGFAQIWRTKWRAEMLRAWVLSNEHSPSNYRVIGATRNQDEWYAAFGVEVHDKYYLPPSQRVHLW